MQRWGTTAAGSVRWFCVHCRKSIVRSRPDISSSARYALFVRWITGTKSLRDIASVSRVSRWTVTCWFRPFWQSKPKPIVPQDIITLIIDGLYLDTRNHCVLIGKTPGAVVFWIFTERETYGSWRLFCQRLPAPRIVVCDGQRGMRAAIRDCWPTTRVQRCVVHVYQLSMARLTRRPKTPAGQALSLILKALFRVRTRRQKRRWIRGYRHWKTQYERFLKERTQGRLPGKKRSWWYTHRRLRSVRTLVDHALPDLFTYIGHPEVPRSTNHVEGGINSRLTELLHRHRGISPTKKEVLVGTFLSQKQGQKPTRNLT